MVRYIDSSRSDANETVGAWMAAACSENLSAVRWQTGYFDADGIGVMLSAFEQIAAVGGRVHALIGSNDGGTLVSDMRRLVLALKLPKPNVKLGIVSYSGGLFHPKVFHVARADGSATAFVGSANLTSQALSGYNVEAGVILDSRAGDAADVLDEIAETIDGWFEAGPPELSLVTSAYDLERLATDGILARQPAPRAPRTSSAAGDLVLNERPRRKRLFALPAVPGVVADNAAAAGSGVAATTGAPSAPITGTPARTPVTAAASAQTPVTSTQGVSPPSPSPVRQPAPVRWEVVWRSKGLTERDLNIPKGPTTHVTGSMTLKKGAWDGVDQRHYFRDDVFPAINWRPHPDPNRPHHEIGDAAFELWKDDQHVGDFTLTLTHSNDTDSETYRQKNAMTHLRWGEALPHVQDRELLGGTMVLQREAGGVGQPRYRIVLTSE